MLLTYDYRLGGLRHLCQLCCSYLVGHALRLHIRTAVHHILRSAQQSVDGIGMALNRHCGGMQGWSQRLTWGGLIWKACRPAEPRLHYPNLLSPMCHCPASTAHWQHGCPDPQSPWRACAPSRQPSLGSPPHSLAPTACAAYITAAELPKVRW